MNKGFSLIEVLVFTAVLGLFFVAAVSVATFNLKNMKMQKNIWFVFFNLIPVSDLDGNKIFFGNNVLWVVLAIVSLIALGYTIFLI